jgi:hypothetical protein
VMAPTPAPQAPAAQREGGRPRYELGAMMGLATPLNRPSRQVGTLAGPSLSAGVVLTRELMLWLDFDSLGNDDASHGSLTLSAGAMRTIAGGKLEVGGRLGVGFTLVNFDEPAFRDVTGSNVRAEALINYPLGDRWQLWARPLGFDLLQNSQLGGPIFTWQIRLGVAARFGAGYPSARRAAPPMGPPPMAPPGAMPAPVAAAGGL